MISALAWVPRGAASLTPKVAEPTEEELEAMKAAAELPDEEEEDDEEEDEEEWETDEDGDSSMDEADEDPAVQARAAARAIKAEKAQKAKDAKKRAGKGGAGGGGAGAGAGLDDELAELDMEHYDDDDEADASVGRIFGSSKPGIMYTNEEDDPYITMKGDVDDDEIEDFNLRGTDLLVLAARNEDDVSHVEVWVYEEDTDGEGANMYVHHDLMLPAFPLSLAWMDLDPRGGGAKGNFVAISTMSPEIEIWDLDTVDSVEPVATLGGEEAPAAPPALGVGGGGVAGAGLEPSYEGLSKEEKKKLKKKLKKQQAKAAAPRLKEGSHSAAVLALAWNAEFRNVLASGSADETVKIWDVVKGTPEHTLGHHRGKVQAVAWNPAEAPVLLTGGFDKRACLVDVRSPTGGVPEWTLTADVEAMAWDPHTPQSFLVSTEDGSVACYDARGGAGSAPVFVLGAHDKPTCALSFHATQPGLLATSSMDKKVKLWDITGGKPSLLAGKDLKVGPVFACAWSKDAPWLLCAGGAKGVVTVWDTMNEDPIREKYSAAA